MNEGPLGPLGRAVDHLAREVDLLRAIVRQLAPDEPLEAADLIGEQPGDLGGHYRTELEGALARALEAGVIPQPQDGAGH